MTATEKATAKIANLTTEQLFDCWEMTEHLSISEETAITRGWLMDQIEKRYPKGFDRSGSQNLRAWHQVRFHAGYQRSPGNG